MPNERVNIIFNTRGVRRVRRDVGGIGDSARTSATAVGFLNRTLGGLGLALSAAEFVRLSDTATRLSNSLRTVTPDVQNLNRVMGELFTVARNTRSAIEPTVELYSRLQRSSQELALSQQELLDLTTGISQAFKIFGNTSAESEAALVQFSQGLAAGALRGDELRSVLEQAPRLARALADGLNEIGDADIAQAFGQGFQLDDGSFDFDIVLGSLRELGEAGELTAERVIAALQTQLGVLDEEFSRTLPTIEDGFEQLRNKAIEFFQGQTAQELGSAIANALILIADNFETLIKVAGVAAFVLGTIFAVNAVGAAVKAMVTLAVLIATNPIGAIAVAILATIGFIYQFGNAIDGVTDSGANLKQEMVAFFLTIYDFGKAAFDGLVKIVKEYFGIAENETIEFLPLWRDILAAMYGSLQSWVGESLGLWTGLSASVAAVFDDIPGAFSVMAVSAATALVTPIVSAINSLYELVRQFVTFLGGVFSSANIEPVEPTAPRNSRQGADLWRSYDRQLSNYNNTLARTQTLQDSVTGQEPLLDADSIIAGIENSSIGRRAAEAGRGIADAFSNGYEDGVGRAEAAFDAFERRFAVRRLEQIAGDAIRRAEREASVGDLTTIGGRPGTRVGGVGDGAEGGSNSRGGGGRSAANQALEEYNRLLSQSNALEAENSKAQSVAQMLVEAGQQLSVRNIDIKSAEAEALAASIGLEQNSAEVMAAKQTVIKDIEGPLREYVVQMTALNQLLETGAISQGQFNEAVAGLGLVRELQDLDESLEGTRFFYESQIQDLRDQQQSMLNTVQEAWEARIITEQEAAGRIVAINQQMHAQIAEAQQSQQSVALTSASDTFGSLADIAKAFGGEQSGIYKAMFAASKAFAIADSIIKIQQGIANALALPFPANLAAVATVASQAASIVSNIQAVALSFRDGGLVMGPGTGTSDSVPANLSNGEFVMRESVTRKNLDLLEALNAGYPAELLIPSASGGPLQGVSGQSAPQLPTSVTAPVRAVSRQQSGPNVNVTIENYGSSKDFDVQYVTEDEVRIIARDTVRQETPSVVSAEIANPNSKVSRSLSQNTTVQRRR